MLTSPSQYQYGCIYKVINLVNGKVYVGQTKQLLEKRWKAHINHANSAKRKGHFQKAITKYGKDQFMVESIIYCNNQVSLDNMEDYFIEKLNALSPNGYVSRGSTHKGQITTEEFKKNMSLSKTQKQLKRIDPSTNCVKIYKCASDLREDGFDYVSVYKVANGCKYRHAYKGYKWEFAPKDGEI